MSHGDLLEKSVILYTLWKFRISMTEEHLFIVILENNIMDYMTYMSQLKLLVEERYAAESTIENKTRYTVTKKGMEFAEMFTKDIPPSIKALIDTSIKKILDNYGRLPEIKAITSALESGKFTAKCGIYEWNQPLLELNVTVGTRLQAEGVTKKFREDSAEIYKSILEMILK